MYPSKEAMLITEMSHLLLKQLIGCPKALPGDTVTVHDGTYREWVNPLNGGEREGKRILYRVAKGEKAEIKGSELVTGWKKEKKGKGVWKVILPNIFFGNYNPYNDKIFGDWFSNHGRDHHTGDVYLNDVSLYETTSVEKVIAPDTDAYNTRSTGANKCLVRRSRCR